MEFLLDKNIHHNNQEQLFVVMMVLEHVMNKISYLIGNKQIMYVVKVIMDGVIVKI